MSEVAGRLAIQAGATQLQKNHGGSGVLLGGVTGVPPAKVVVIGGGTVGVNAAKMAVGLRARVVVVDKNADRLAYLVLASATTSRSITMDSSWPLLLRSLSARYSSS